MITLFLSNFIHTLIYNSLQQYCVAQRFEFSPYRTSRRSKVLFITWWFSLLQIGQATNTVIHSSVKMQVWATSGKKVKDRKCQAVPNTISDTQTLFLKKIWYKFLVPIACRIEHKTVATHKHTRYTHLILVHCITSFITPRLVFIKSIGLNMSNSWWWWLLYFLF